MGEVKLLFIVKFKDEVSAEEIDDFIHGYKKFVDIIKPLKSTQYGTGLGSTNFQQGFTHVFESVFESKEAIAEFLIHPTHVEFAQTQGASKLDKFLVIDFHPTQYP